MIHDFRELMGAAVKSGPKSVSVAAADENETLSAIIEASKMRLVKSILVGNREWIEVMLEKAGIRKEAFEIIHEKDSVKAAAIAAQLSQEKADSRGT